MTLAYVRPSVTKTEILKALGPTETRTSAEIYERLRQARIARDLPDPQSNAGTHSISQHLRQMRDDEKNQYVENGGINCPHCGHSLVDDLKGVPMTWKLTTKGKFWIAMNPMIPA